MNTEITLLEVRKEAMEAIQQLKSNKMDVQTASEIRNLLGTIIDTAKVQVEFLKAIPNSLKEKMSEDSIRSIAGTLSNNNIGQNKSKLPLFDNPYETINTINKEND